MFESKYSKLLTTILVVVIVAIVILLGFLAFDYIHKVNTTKEASEFVESFDSENITSDKNANNTVDGNVTLDNSEESPNSNGSSSRKRKYKGFTVVGTMKIPEISLEYPVLEEVTTKSLETGLVALYPSPDNINLPGNTVVIGHNYRNGLYFSNLKKLSKGAKVYVKDYRGKTITYEVYNKFEAKSTDTSFYSRDTKGLAELTLSTCTDASNDQRTILFAKEIK